MFIDMNINFIKETCLYVKDLERTKHFYHEVLGFPLISFVADRHVFFRAGKSVLLCFLAEVTKEEKNLPPHYAKGKMHLAFEVNKTEYEQWKERVILLDIEITHEQKWEREFTSFYFDDPDGHVLEVVQNGMWD